jgi:hypothetical protein
MEFPIELRCEEDSEVSDGVAQWHSQGLTVARSDSSCGWAAAVMGSYAGMEEHYLRFLRIRFEACTGNLFS